MIEKETMQPDYLINVMLDIVHHRNYSLDRQKARRLSYFVNYHPDKVILFAITR